MIAKRIAVASTRASLVPLATMLAIFQPSPLASSFVAPFSSGQSFRSCSRVSDIGKGGRSIYQSGRKPSPLCFSASSASGGSVFRGLGIQQEFARVVETPTIGAADITIIVGKKAQIEDSLDAILASMSSQPSNVVPEPIKASLLDAISSNQGGTASTWFVADVNGGVAQQLVLCATPTKLSRNNHALAAHSMTDMVAKNCGNGKKSCTVVALVDSPDADIGPVTSALAKSFPLFDGTSKSTAEVDEEINGSNISVFFFDAPNQAFIADSNALKHASVVSRFVKVAADLVDMPPNQLNTDYFTEKCKTFARECETVEFTEIVGENLESQGYGGIYSVGKAGVEPPRLVKMEYTPVGADDDAETIALVGKGIIYDTGGLSLKPKTGMCGMKHDMGGAAGMFGGFAAAVSLNVPKKITLLLCLAENAIGPTAFRNDDIIRMYSGKTVEVNNCDAEGRLVLGDGVAHATKHVDGLDLVVDMATLTGAQLVTTGKRHAGVLANSDELEQRAVKAGMRSGDLVYPMLYCPEILMDEFKSKVADMKNSVKDRSNAQASCAGHFIESHLDEAYQGGWLHVDMAGPGTKEERGTGYGVGLVLALLEAPGFEP